MTYETDQLEIESQNKAWHSWLYHVVLVCILIVGAYLRLVGIDWDEEEHLHPDERFLTMVESAIQLPGVDPEVLGPPPTVSNQQWRSEYIGVIPDCQEWGGYFDTACSPLNPNNRGYDFYVYGTLPIFIVRFVAEYLGQTGYGEVYLVGRFLSAISDLLVILLVYAIAALLYDRRVGLLAAAFSAFSVLLIQQSHFFTVDTFTNFFVMLALYFAVRIAVNRQATVTRSEAQAGDDSGSFRLSLRGFYANPIFWFSIAFGLSLGMAVASKINAAPLALTLPGAALIYLLRLPPRDRDRQFLQVFLYLVIAAIVSVLAFRVFQPYAFSGPGFFGIKPNRAWIDDLSALRAQTGGDVDFPPALQWARRPVWFSLQNLVYWGLGIPLGVLAWVGFLWMGWMIFRGEWKRHGVLWGWTAFYFCWQSLQWNSTMRYQLPVYPLLVIFGAWYLFQLWDKAKAVRAHTFNLKRVLVFMLGALVLGLTFAWGFAFSRIYTRPHTRVEASRWLFQNMPGPVNLSILTQDGIYNQPLAYPQDVTIRANFPYQIRFNALADGTLTEIYLPHAVDKMSTTDLSLMLTLSSLSEDQIVATETISAQELYNGSGAPYAYTWQEPTALIQGETYSLALSLLNDYEDLAICGPLVLDIQTVSGPLQLELPLYAGCLGPADLPYPLQFGMDVTGILQNVSMTIQIEQPEIESQSKTLAVEMVGPGGEILVSEELTADFESKDGQRGQSYRIPIANGPAVQNGESYTLNFSLESGVAAIAFSGSSAANESSWDDGLPLRLDGYDPYGGIYPGGLNFEMYWDDNLEKFERFVTTLDQADYILITSSRQWASTTRVPERYPLTTEYYRRLLGCPVENTIEWCYDVAEPGRFQGDLGFALVKVFQSNPSIGTFEINDQFSEEAFTVYDHPKVFVFEKTVDYDPAGVRNLLGAVDLTKVIRVTPKQADSFPGSLMLPPGRLEEQRRGGTWSDYFNPEALQNRLQILGVLLWYGSVGLLGLLVYPLVRFTMPGLADRGYPFARITGLLLLSAIVWLAGSARLPFNRTTIGLALGAIVLLGVFLGYRQREQLRREFTERKQYFLWIEVLFLVFFLVGLLIRFGNPDLWHPWKGGEKPMDFAYFNAVLKSTSFPPYDPWFAGGYINYYYYGFVVVGVLVKFLGIVPSIAYNLILPTLLSMIAMGAFSIVWNLFGSDPKEPDNPGGMDGSDIPKSGSREKRHPVRSLQFIASLSGALGMAILGNLGILQMFAKGLQMNAVPAAELETAGFFSKLFWTFSGFFKTIAGTPLPIRMDEWYWNPSRVIAAQHGSPITEFPFFTFLYADLHAHLIALPVALLGVAWVVSVVRGRAWERTGGRSWLQIGLGLLLGGLAIGALYPINLSDIYTYLPLGAAALVYATWRYVDVEALTVMKGLSKTAKRLVISGLAVLALVALTQIIYQPYIHWFDQGYSKFRIWDGTHTPLSEYLTHWGVFLFILVSWMFYESIDWMANTPASALRKLAPYRGLIWAGVSLTIILMMVLGINLYPQGLPPDKVPIGLGIHIVWLVLPLVVWSGVLLLRPGISDAKRIVLFMVGTGLVLTLMVELIVVSGDIGRMNTVFKFYFHAWTFFAVSSGAALGWLVTSMPKWSLNTRTVWQILLGFLVFSAALYPLLGSTAKIMDRMEVTAPHTLDGMTYMRYATYADEGATMDLSQDYNAIRWMQENIVGSPVLVEANLVEYHWGTRFSSYTGLPEVVGWNWHERQKRTATPQDWVYERVDAVHEFYQTEDLQWVREFLQKYEISYIIFGQLEQARYPGPGLDKFTAQDGILWHEIFRDRDTIIYQVIR